MGLFSPTIMCCGHVQNESMKFIYFRNGVIIFHGKASTKDLEGFWFKGKMSFNSITSAKNIGYNHGNVVYSINGGSYVFQLKPGCELHSRLANKFE